MYALFSLALIRQNSCVHLLNSPRKVAYFIETIDALMRNCLYAFVQRCARTSNFFIRSLQMSNAFQQISIFFSHYV